MPARLRIFATGAEAAMVKMALPAPNYHVYRDSVILSYECNTCRRVTQLQLVFPKGAPLKTGCAAFPRDGQFDCPGCSARHNVAEAQREMEKMCWRQADELAAEVAA